MRRKILTAQIREEIYNLLISRGLFLEEQKGYRKGTRSIGQLLYIDQHILNERKMRRKNIPMTWIDYKKLTIWSPKAGYYTVSKCLNTRQSNTIYREDYGNLESVIDRGKKKLS